MVKFLITPSLYGSYLWYTDTDFSLYGDNAEQYEQDAYMGWLDTLNKVKTPTTEAQQKGIDFENVVQALTNSGNIDNLLSEDELSAAKETADILGKGGIWQQTLMKETDNYLLYGRADYIRQDTIYDVKRTGSYEAGKYIKSIQHQIYFEGAENLEHFKYVVAAGKTNPSVYVEYFHKEPNNLETLLGKIDNMVGFIKSVPEFYTPFIANWIAR